MRRVALYADGDGSGLVRCARAAKATGERVVAMSAEWSATPGEGLGGPTLRRLMDRMQSGEFDCIIADLRSGDGAEQGVVVRFDTAPIAGGGAHLDRGGPTVVKALLPGSKVAAYARYAASNQNAHVNGLRQLNSERAAVVRQIFRDYSADIEIRDITEALNAEAVSKLVQP